MSRARPSIRSRGPTRTRSSRPGCRRSTASTPWCAAEAPVFAGPGLPAAGIAARIATGARVPGDDGRFSVVFAALGIPRAQAVEFQAAFDEAGVLDRTTLVLNLADEPTVERILAPRVALTLAEHLAFSHGEHVLVVLTDLTSYAEALREVAAARDELPGRRGYPGYMYTDLAALFERAGRIRGGSGSLTQVMVLTMPDGDITHPVPDLTGYITEGQIVLSRDLAQHGVDPPIDVLPSLSRLMNAGIGAGRTREDHRPLAAQLYASYARGLEVRRLMSIVGENALDDEDRAHLRFADDFERRFVGHGTARRGIAETLNLGWQLLAGLPRATLARIPDTLLDAHLPPTPVPGGKDLE